VLKRRSVRNIVAWVKVGRSLHLTPITKTKEKNHTKNFVDSN